MMSFIQYLNEISYVGNIQDVPKNSIRSNKNILPNPDAGKIIKFYNPELYDLLKTATYPPYRKLFEPIPKEIDELSDISSKLTKLSASDVYSLREFMNKIINKSPDDSLVKSAQNVLEDLENSIKV